MAGGNPFEGRLQALRKTLAARRLDAALVFDEANVRSLTGIACDNACLLVPAAGRSARVVFHTDFRYAPMVRRVAPALRVGDIRTLGGVRRGATALRLGYESSVTHARYLALRRRFPGCRFVDVAADLARLRSVKTDDEIARLAAAESLNDRIWSLARRRFRPGMTELDMARVIRRLMIDLGEGEAFPTIVCVGKNAAECHHVPDATVWSGREPVLVDMGVKLDGYCSDMTRNLVPPRPGALYRKVYGLVLEANLRAIAAARPGITAGDLDKVARDFLTEAGYGEAFGHSLGHGVGLEIHEAPTARRGDTTVLEPGMLVTIEPGVYLEGRLGVRIEDLVVITETGCRVLSASAKRLAGVRL